MQLYYTGIGCNTNGIHTETEFLNLMNSLFTNRDWNDTHSKIFNYQLQFKDFSLPDDFKFFTLSNWVEYSGAEYIIQA
jgi:hypothetical protein